MKFYHNYEYFQNKVKCYDMGNGSAKCIICAGLIFLSFKGIVKVKYNTIISNSIFRTDDALYKVSKGYSEQEVLDKLKEYVISSGAPCKI